MIYAVVTLTVTEPETFAAYAEQAGPAMAKWGAKPFAMSTSPTRLEGDMTLPGRVVILAFPDRDAALGWIADPDIADVHALRRASGTCDIVLVG